MVVQQFPPHSTADRHGLLAVGGDLDLETLLLAYRQGIFPWPFVDGELAWFSPRQRGIIPVPPSPPNRTLRKLIKKQDVRCTVNAAFSKVVEACSEAHRAKGEWLFSPLRDAYRDLFAHGHAYSVEVWRGEVLVGGIFGVTIGAYYSGESMFHREDNMSKIALWHLLVLLEQRGATFLDCQVVTPATAAFGATLVSRAAFQKMLKTALSRK